MSKKYIAPFCLVLLIGLMGLAEYTVGPFAASMCIPASLLLVLLEFLRTRKPVLELKHDEDRVTMKVYDSVFRSNTINLPLKVKLLGGGHIAIWDKSMRIEVDRWGIPNLLFKLMAVGFGKELIAPGYRLTKPVYNNMDLKEAVLSLFDQRYAVQRLKYHMSYVLSCLGRDGVFGASETAKKMKADLELGLTLDHIGIPPYVREDAQNV